MAQAAGSMNTPAGRAAPVASPQSSLRFDWGVAILSAWLLFGLFLDGWAHTHGIVDSSFFTPWHAVLYSGFIVVSGFMIANALINRSRGVAWRQAIPAGYIPSVIGVGIFAAAGILDMLWHTLFGVEREAEALVSPTHLMLALGMLLIHSGPLRAAYGRAGNQKGWAALAPAVLSLTFTFSMLGFFLAYGHPYVDMWPSLSVSELHQVSDWAVRNTLGLAGILLQTTLMMGAVLFMLRRWRALPFGALTLFIGITNSVITLSHDQFRFIPAAFIAGLLADGLLVWLKPSQERDLALRGFAFGVPVIFYLTAFTLLMIQSDMAWSIHLWAGSTVLAGGLGVLLSYGFMPPAIPDEQRIADLPN